jgi:soluble cytochrome b562
MPIRTRTLATLGLFTLLLSSPTIAQTGGTSGESGPAGDASERSDADRGRRGDRMRGERGNRGASPEMIANRMMRADADEDGRISEAEASDASGNGRFFAQADGDGDGYVTRIEVMQFAETRLGNRTTGRGGATRSDPQDAAKVTKPVDPREAFNEAMTVSGRALRSLRRAKFDTISLDNDLKSVWRLQESLMIAKQHSGSVPMSDAAKAKFGSDEKAYRAAFQIDMIKAMLAALQIEQAALEGNAAGAKAAVKTVVTIRSDSHDLFEN